MQGNHIKTGPQWRGVLAALYRANQFISLEQLTKSLEAEEPAVMNALDFLQKQGWAECQLDNGFNWSCTAQARTIIESMALFSEKPAGQIAQRLS